MYMDQRLLKTIARSFKLDPIQQNAFIDSHHTLMQDLLLHMIVNYHVQKLSDQDLEKFKLLINNSNKFGDPLSIQNIINQIASTCSNSPDLFEKIANTFSKIHRELFEYFLTNGEIEAKVDASHYLLEKHKEFIEIKKGTLEEKLY